ncbi:MBL fold metallo-hydrolase [Xenorhabdus sp. PB62.4]|uniref:MBL fold metallo-hydrolase n=1 Tax=Xenorhabdus sp. PB62.4 TaxID=1851573 RepID=UPI0016569190|nr:MBL fold metallo-hydrolase [Xenorhabdus sp. PB62.4]MBC8954003.1 putative Rieske 2Fe-2S iron-sulfur protein [Xenorhabdus sp. PB62.4]
MKWTYLGHACYFIETSDLTILIDPLLTSVFQAGTAQVCPDRLINIEQIPKIDVIIITHQHPGHFEPESLSMLNRDALVIYPPLPSVKLCLNMLGFSNTQIAETGDRIEISSLKILFTGEQEHADFEFGCTVKDEQNVVSFTGDSHLDIREVRRIKTFCKQVPVLIGGYPDVQHRFLTYWDLDFPSTDIEKRLTGIKTLAPLMFSPNCSGMKYIEKYDWANYYSFPMHPKDFIEEIKPYLLGIEMVSLLPGDVISVVNGIPNLDTQASPIVKSIGDFDRPRVDPTKNLPLLLDDDPKCVGANNLEKAVFDWLKNKLTPWLEMQKKLTDGPISKLCKQQVQYGIEIILPSNISREYVIEFSQSGITLEKHSLKSLPYASLHIRICASALLACEAGEIPYFVLYFNSRVYSTLHRIFESNDGEFKVQRYDVRDPIFLYFNNDPETHFNRWLTKESNRLIQD